MLLAPIVMTGAAFAALAYLLSDLMTRPRLIEARSGRFEVERREQLRIDSPVYRWMEPWVDELAGTNRSNGATMESIRKNLVLAGASTPWKPEEYLAVKRIEGILVGLSLGLLGTAIGGMSMAAGFAAAGMIGYPFACQTSLAGDAKRRQIKLKRRFAASIDLMALMMEAGAGFPESLTKAAEEAKGHPLGKELAIVRRDINMGKGYDALKAFADRTQDDDVGEVVMAVLEGEKNGTPLSTTLKKQADQMRQKRSQWAEKAAAEAEVALVFPAMLIMVGCLIIVAAPFILTAIFTPGV